MQTLKFKGTIDSDHRLTLQLPADTPVGEADVIILVPDVGAETPRERLRNLFNEIDRSAHARLSKEDIDRHVAEERANWD